MTIPAAIIIEFMTPEDEVDLPGICDEVRDRLEWTWGLGHDHLDEYLQRFVDPQRVLMDDRLLVFPHSDMIREISARNRKMKSGVRRSHIDKGCKSFEYVVVPLDRSSPLPARTLISDVPPHLVLCTTSGKFMDAWGYLTGEDYTTVRVSLIEHLKTASPTDKRPPLTLWDLDAILQIYRTWSFMDPIPSTFISEASDQMMVEVEEESGSDGGMAWEVGSSVSCRHEPKRRLLPSERQQDVIIRLFPSTDNQDYDNAISLDSHITGVDDPDEFAEASMARGDYEEDGEWLEGMAKWAKGTSGATEQILLNDGQIPDDPREQPRVATSLDLDKPDYLSKSRKRTTT
ncbi:hypothetical protein B0H11DRAFT_1928418 [Mycena galericulata]|nr:hypothetical protein B0H11DRAFT_1928418 [Mycena galericulata]